MRLRLGFNPCRSQHRFLSGGGGGGGGGGEGGEGGEGGGGGGDGSGGGHASIFSAPDRRAYEP